MYRILVNLRLTNSQDMLRAEDLPPEQIRQTTARGVWSTPVQRDW